MSQNENNRPVEAAFAPSGSVMAKVALRQEAKTTLLRVIIGARFACKVGAPEGARIQRVYFIFLDR